MRLSATQERVQSKLDKVKVFNKAQLADAVRFSRRGFGSVYPLLLLCSVFDLLWYCLIYCIGDACVISFSWWKQLSICRLFELY
ncbi:hypothetical protein NEOLI_001336 [Neolecta irregularis DAH-3]|uniref:Uncharacterized protein n=1 Tax=Neolecta irregularis (strain DAH-3) TaxID=1198029 RepID=A0A1U7LW07_NEOID|nr:hypothetical protein NEOLI_001336 [Neolecta irregularis DAH-3]|eukprot:OLL26732.1 hypothetical protein NEOLI_001336 [Neolecta irregularis DAH-3]